MRLDLYLADSGKVSSRTRAANLISMGRVVVNGQTVTKSSFNVEDKDIIEITEDYEASLGSLKLEEAIKKFSVNCTDKVCVDIGASNGGFTDVLLKSGAQSVYAVDVGECALPDYIKNDTRVVVLDRTNARYLQKNQFEPLPELAVIDVSFISLKLILPSVIGILREGATVIALIKPQFECSKKDLTKRGILNNPKKCKEILNSIEFFCNEIGLKSRGIIPAPHPFANKNQEYLICLSL